MVEVETQVAWPSLAVNPAARNALNKPSTTKPKCPWVATALAHERPKPTAETAKNLAHNLIKSARKAQGPKGPRKWRC